MTTIAGLPVDDSSLVDKRPFWERPEYFNEAFTLFSTGLVLTSQQKWELAQGVLPLGRAALSPAYPGVNLWAQHVEDRNHGWPVVLVNVEFGFVYIEGSSRIPRSMTLSDLMVRLHKVNDRLAWDLAAAAVILAGNGARHSTIADTIRSQLNLIRRDDPNSASKTKTRGR